MYLYNSNELSRYMQTFEPSGQVCFFFVFSARSCVLHNLKPGIALDLHKLVLILHELALES